MLGELSSISGCAELMIVHSPGRFFAANELKALLAHIVMNYDVKMEKEGQIPPSVWYTNSRSPNRDAEVLFRKRQK